MSAYKPQVLPLSDGHALKRFWAFGLTTVGSRCSPTRSFDFAQNASSLSAFPPRGVNEVALPPCRRQGDRKCPPRGISPYLVQLVEAERNASQDDGESTIIAPSGAWGTWARQATRGVRGVPLAFLTGTILHTGQSCRVQGLEAQF